MTKDCSTCICKEGSCYPSLTIFDKDKTCKSYMPDYEGYIADLEKENEILKGDLELWESGGCRATNLFKCGVAKELKDQLAKAIGIIKDLLGSENTSCEEEMFFEIRQKAEQFLKEIEK